MAMMKKAFTLMEVNLAILVMAGGLLSIAGLYSLGFKENEQSSDDVASAALADAVISPIVMAASATNMKWSVFRNLPSYPSNLGWGEFINSNTGLVDRDPNAAGTFSQVIGALTGGIDGNGSDYLRPYPSEIQSGSGLAASGLVVLHDIDSTVLRIAFRGARQRRLLMAAPLYYTEVRFQGDPDK